MYYVSIQSFVMFSIASDSIACHIILTCPFVQTSITIMHVSFSKYQFSSMSGERVKQMRRQFIEKDCVVPLQTIRNICRAKISCNIVD